MSTPTPDTGAPETAATGPAAQMTASEERTWTMVAHLSGLLAFVGPLIVFLVQKDRSAAVAREAKESLNFQITIAIYFTALMILGTILTFVVIGVFLLMIAPLVPLAGAVYSIVAGVTVNNRGGSFRYPLTIRVVR